MQKRYLPVFLAVILVFLVAFSFSSQPFSKIAPTPAAPTPTPEQKLVTLSGKMICLPHKNASGPQTTECAFGIVDSSGKNYALHDTSSDYSQVSSATNSRPVVAIGFLVPPMPNDKYDTVGTINLINLLSYIQPIDWPPASVSSDQAFSCTAAGSTGARAGKTESKDINGRTYCVTVITEGAAGSIYSQYAYAIPWHKQTLSYTFSFRTPQCANYPEPEMSACKKEVSAFNPDTILDAFVHSLR